MVNKNIGFIFKTIESSRWQQCYLAGINHMLLGFRDDYGIVNLLQPLSTKDIEIRAVNFFIQSAKSSNLF